MLALGAGPAWSFPPYRSTDADTAGADTLELQVGLAKIERTGSSSQRTAPLTRTNLGLGDRFEVTSELEYSTDDGRLGEGALGFKWARLEEGRGHGVETLILLPVGVDHGGLGLESQFLTTVERETWQMHFNVGGFYDARPRENDRGWRASLLAEFPRRRLRPGLELFAKDAHSEDIRIQVGAGIIAELGRLDVRAGLHIGLSDAAPDLEASVWLASKWQLPRKRP